MSILLSLLTFPPSAVAESSTGPEEDDDATCVEVNIFNFPPVYTYECPDGTIPPVSIVPP